MSIYRCYVSLLTLEICEISRCKKTKRIVNAFPTMSAPALIPHAYIYIKVKGQLRLQM